MSCNTEHPDDPNRDFLCTATVGDASGQSPVLTPTGAVSFAIDAGHGGLFQGGSTCTLTPSPSSPTASCTVTYLPGSESVPPGTQPPLTGSYAGDATFGASAGRPAGIGPPPDTTTTTTTPTPDPVVPDAFVYRRDDTIVDTVGKTAGKGVNMVSYCVSGAFYLASMTTGALSGSTAQGVTLAAGFAAAPVTGAGSIGAGAVTALVMYPVHAVAGGVEQVSGKIMDDPPRSDLRTFARVRPVHPKLRGLSPSQAKLLNGELDFKTYSAAAAITIDRAGGAREARNQKLYARQVRLSADLLRHIATLDVSLAAELVTAAQLAASPTLTAADLVRAKKAFRRPATPALKRTLALVGLPYPKAKTLVLRAKTVPTVKQLGIAPADTLLPSVLQFEHAGITAYLRLPEVLKPQLKSGR